MAVWVLKDAGVRLAFVLLFQFDHTHTQTHGPVLAASSTSEFALSFAVVTEWPVGVHFGALCTLWIHVAVVGKG